MRFTRDTRVCFMQPLSIFSPHNVSPPHTSTHSTSLQHTIALPHHTTCLAYPIPRARPQSPFIIVFFAPRRTNTTYLHLDTVHLTTTHHCTVPSHIHLLMPFHAFSFITYRLPCSLDTRCSFPPRDSRGRSGPPYVTHHLVLPPVAEWLLGC